MVGAIGIAVNAVALVFFAEVLSIHYAVAAILASQVSTLHNFVLTEWWVFRGHKSHRHLLVRYLAFNALNIATLFVRVPVIVFLTEWFGVHYLISNFLAIGLTFGLRYVVAENWIWAGRDASDQRPVDGWFNYRIHDVATVRSQIALPELAVFNVVEQVAGDIVVSRKGLLGGWPRLRTSISSDGSVIRYREQFGLGSVAFDVELGPTVQLRANWLLAWSHHVLYTNMVEPLLRFLMVSRDSVLLHAASVDADRGAVLLSAQTDTGKTSTLLRLLMQHDWAFMGDDMAVVKPDGTVLSYAKPMTLSFHTMSAVNEAALPLADRIMLAIRSRVHSKKGRSIGQAIGRAPVPIVTINAVVQLLVPPPKYHVSSLIDCDFSSSAPIDAVILMERGEPVLEEMELEAMLDALLANTEDAYTFPPFATFAPLLTFGGRDLAGLRERERDLLRTAVVAAWRVRLRVVGHEWSTIIPTLLDGTRTASSTGAVMPPPPQPKVAAGKVATG